MLSLNTIVTKAESPRRMSSTGICLPEIIKNANEPMKTITTAILTAGFLMNAGVRVSFMPSFLFNHAIPDMNACMGQAHPQ